MAQQTERSKRIESLARELFIRRVPHDTGLTVDVGEYADVAIYDAIVFEEMFSDSDAFETEDDVF